MREDHSRVTPYGDGSEKKDQVSRMFDRIAGRYDLLNRVLSLGIDQWWRKRLVRHLQSHTPKVILDIATGTGDVAIALATQLDAKRIDALDIAERMLEIGRQKVARKKLDEVVHFDYGDAENLQASNNTYDAVTVAFGVRNFQDTKKGLSECHRVLKPGGRLAVLEFTKPTLFPFKQLYQVYFSTILPFIGRLTSRDSKAYTYLFESVESFAQGEEFLQLLRSVGFQECKHSKLTLGICALYTAAK